jgi:hypothetical protein
MAHIMEFLPIVVSNFREQVIKRESTMLMTMRYRNSHPGLVRISNE